MYDDEVELNFQPKNYRIKINDDGVLIEVESSRVEIKKDEISMEAGGAKVKMKEGKIELN